MVNRVCVLVAIAILLAPALADAQGTILRGRALFVSPDADSSTIGDTGTSVDVDDAVTLEIDLTLMFSETFGLEIVAATSEHDIETIGGAIGGADAGSVWVLPPTVTLQYHFPTDTGFRPYIGAGVNFTYFYSYDLSADLEALGVIDIDFEESFSFAAGVGADVLLQGNWLLNFDVKYVDMDTEAELQTATGVLDTIDVDINPWLVGVGVGYRF